MVDLQDVKGLADWQHTRKDLEAAVLNVLGKPPKPAVELQTKVIDEVELSGYTRRRVNYFVDEWTRASAWMFVPDGKDQGPAILCCHQKTHRGKDEPAGIDGSPLLAFAQHYAERGYVTIAPDSVLAGERISSGLEPFDTKQFYKDFPKYSVMAKMLSDHQQAIEVLMESKSVDPARIGVIGHDLGGVNALLLAGFDDRIQACVASCAFTMFSEDPNPERWSGKNGFIMFPKLRKAVETKEFPFDWDGILAMIAPCPTRLITALNDDVLPNTRSADKAATRAKKIYKLLGAESAIDNVSLRSGHVMSQEALEAADEWFERWL